MFFFSKLKSKQNYSVDIFSFWITRKNIFLLIDKTDEQQLNRHTINIHVDYLETQYYEVAQNLK